MTRTGCREIDGFVCRNAIVYGAVRLCNAIKNDARISGMHERSRSACGADFPEQRLQIRRNVYGGIDRD